MTKLKAPFPAFGGKSVVAALVWERLGDPDNFVEPFFNSGAVLLSRPHAPRVETCNDADTMISGRGSVFSFVVNHYPQVPAFDYPLPIGLIELHEGTRLVGDLVGVEPAAIRIGLPVVVEFVDHDPELTLPAFRPVEP